MRVPELNAVLHRVVRSVYPATSFAPFPGAKAKKGLSRRDVLARIDSLPAECLAVYSLVCQLDGGEAERRLNPEVREAVRGLAACLKHGIFPRSRLSIKFRWVTYTTLKDGHRPWAHWLSPAEAAAAGVTGSTYQSRDLGWVEFHSGVKAFAAVAPLLDVEPIPFVPTAAAGKLDADDAA
jgi:hypothetical protein